MVCRGPHPLKFAGTHVAYVGAATNAVVEWHLEKALPVHHSIYRPLLQRNTGAKVGKFDNKGGRAWLGDVTGRDRGCQ